MRDLIRIAVVGGSIACAILIFVVGITRNAAVLLAPLNLLLFLLLLTAYFLPTGLAVQRGCKHMGWIAALNILLGWTLFGWVIALGWAASGRTELRGAQMPHDHAMPHRP